MWYIIIKVISPRDDVIKWKYFPRYWTFVRGIHRSPVNSPHKGQRRGVLILSLIWAWTNCWADHRDANDLRRQRSHYDVTVMSHKSWATGTEMGNRLKFVVRWWQNSVRIFLTRDVDNIYISVLSIVYRRRISGFRITFMYVGTTYSFDRTCLVANRVDDAMEFLQAWINRSFRRFLKEFVRLTTGHWWVAPNISKPIRCY